jgi:hypothetical protein
MAANLEEGQLKLVVTEKASEELKKVLDSDKSRGKYLILYFQGAG